MTLQDTLTHLTTLARDCGAEIQLTTQMEFIGATLMVHWSEGSSDGGIPREANLYFGPEGDSLDSFLWGFIVCPHRFCWALDEGLTHEQAEGMATLLVESVEDVSNYLAGQPYNHYRPRQKPARE